MLVLLASGILIALMDAEMAGILQRYFADFTVLFLMVSVLTVFILNENLDHGGAGYEIAMKILPVLVGVSLAYSFLLFLVPETGWYSDILEICGGNEEKAFYRFVELYDAFRAVIAVSPVKICELSEENINTLASVYNVSTLFIALS